LETEWKQGQVHESGRPLPGREPGGGVRAFVVAMKHRNGCGAKGRREVEDGMNGRPEGELATVSGETKQARDIRVRRNWMEPEVWTDRMLTTLNKESKEQEAQIDGGSSLAECFLCGMWLLSPCAAHTFVRQSLGRANHQLESRMRETRQSGSEGGGTSVLPTPINRRADTNARFLRD